MAEPSKRVAAMQPTDCSDQYTVAPDVLIEARSMIVHVAGKRLEGEEARRFLELVLAPPDYYTATRAAAAFADKCG
jgi:hypothetical protein